MDDYQALLTAGAVFAGVAALLGAGVALLNRYNRRVFVDEPAAERVRLQERLAETRTIGEMSRLYRHGAEYRTDEVDGEVVPVEVVQIGTPILRFERTLDAVLERMAGIGRESRAKFFSVGDVNEVHGDLVVSVEYLARSN